jgi:hypothetical protein
MLSMLRSFKHACPVVVGLCFLLAPLGAQDPTTGDIAELQTAAKQYQITVGLPARPVQCQESPLLKFTNPERNQERGSVFVWLDEGVPVVVGQLFRFTSPRGVRQTKHAFHSLFDGPVRATDDGAVAWAPTQPGIKWQWLTDFATPAESSSGRLLQMRQAARRFRVTLTSPKQQVTELRLTPRPLLDYAAPTRGLLQGTMMSFVVATDPEAILLLEAVETSGQRRYRYAFARFHFQELKAMDGETEVWHVDYDPSLMQNQPGTPATMSKPYNSFYR